MAQFLQRLAGWTDAQIAEKYADAPTKFQDISALRKSNPQRYNAILWLADTGITVGCHPSGIQFCPNSPVIRGAMAEFMQKFAGVKNVPSSTSVFPDVKTKDVTVKYHHLNQTSKVKGLSQARIGAINWLAQNKITQGSGHISGKSAFRPQDPVNRGAMAEFMRKLADALGSTSAVTD
jgi:hypothetical protein